MGNNKVLGTVGTVVGGVVMVYAIGVATVGWISVAKSVRQTVTEKISLRERFRRTNKMEKKEEA